MLILPSIIPAQEWTVRYNGPGNLHDKANAIALDNAGVIYVTGYSLGSGTGDDYATIKYDTLGVEQWVARYNGPGNSQDVATAIAVVNADNIYVTGRSVGYGTSWDYATVKYDSSGVEQWVVRYHGPGNQWDCANAIALDNAGNIYVTGYSWGSGTGDDYATIKYDTLGVEQWVARHNGPGNGGDQANAIAVDDAGHIYVTGRSYGSGTGGDYATMKYDTLGVEQWVVRYIGPGIGGDQANAIAVDNAGHIYVTGGSQGSGTYQDYATIKYDTLGVEQWVARYNGPVNQYDVATAIAVDDAGHIYVTGRSYGSGTGGDYATMKYDSSGVEQWVARYSGPVDGEDQASAIVVDNSGYVYVTGWSEDSGTGFDYATIKYSSVGIEESRITAQIKSSSLHATIFRGPLQLPEGKKCKVFDITGRVVEPINMSPGIYFLEIDGKITQKVVKLR